MAGETSEIPAYVQNALDNWNELAFVAYDWYEQMGRLAIGIEEDEEYAGSARLLAAIYDYDQGKPDAATAELIASYDPVHEIVIQFIDALGRPHTQRLRTAPGARHPKRVYFFEMLRRVNEEPHTVDPDALPSWLIEALETLEKIRKK
jgi:hypothetical protein